MVAIGVIATRDLQVDRLVLSRQLLGQALEDRPPLAVAERILHADRGQAAIEAAQVVIDPKGDAAVSGHHFVHAVAEQQASVGDRQARLAAWQEFAV